jgi:hypothetical protein
MKDRILDWISNNFVNLAIQLAIGIALTLLVLSLYWKSKETRASSGVRGTLIELWCGEYAKTFDCEEIND